MATDNPVKHAVFLSAGVPDQPDRGSYMDTADPIAIRDAVRALTSVVLQGSCYLVFGGHPAITPLVAQIASSLDALPSVIIYQSRWFEEVTPKEVDWFENIRWTERMNDIPASLLEMRRRMFTGDGLRIDSAVYIGGMNGVEEEYEMCREYQPEAMHLPIASTGGAALNLWESGIATNIAQQANALRNNHHYTLLFEHLLG